MLRGPVSPEQTALLVIDVQNDFCHPKGTFGRAGLSLEATHQAVQRLKGFIDAVRSTGAAVIFVRTHHDHWTDSAVWDTRAVRNEDPICATGTWGANFYEVEPAPGDLVVTKHRYSAFHSTNLDLVLRSRKIHHVLCTGFTTNVCVESTARDGFMLGYRTVLVSDCTAAPTPSEHESALYNVARYFGEVASSDEIIAALHTPDRTRA